MQRDLILGTAGHIDHGKTSLVKALTGIDCDRLPEEKQRGITIDIGFAKLDVGTAHLGIVDVPGHERFIKNMLAGATGIDLALLVVAADDGIMPQTREHLAILGLLGLRHGVIALTKADLVDATTREVVAWEIRQMVQGTFLQDAPLIATSVVTGMGLDALKSALAEVSARVVRQQTDQWFRLAIDRAFVVQGHGTVVTGSVASGRLRVGDEVEWLPLGERVRVRALQHHDCAVEEVHSGQRAALNLAGVPLERIQRGHELAYPGYLRSDRVVTVRLHTLPSAPRAIAHRAQLHLHLGTSEHLATVSLLDGDTVEPGQWGLAQWFVAAPIVAVWGQPFVVRDASAQHTLGGGHILQPNAKKIRRRQGDVLHRLELLGSDDPRQRAAMVAWFAADAGLELADLVRGAGLTPRQAEQIRADLLAEGELLEFTLPGTKTLLLHCDRVAELEQRLLQRLEQWHREFPSMTGHDRPKLVSEFHYLSQPTLIEAILDRMLRAGRLVGTAQRIARTDFQPKLSANLRKLKEKVIAEHRRLGFQPPEPSVFASQAGGNAAHLKELYEVCVLEGELVRINDEIYLHAESAAEMRRRLVAYFAQNDTATVAEIRDLLGTTRKYAVPICEYLDRLGFTKRLGDLRVRGPTPLEGTR